MDEKECRGPKDNEKGNKCVNDLKGPDSVKRHPPALVGRSGKFNSSARVFEPPGTWSASVEDMTPPGWRDMAYPSKRTAIYRTDRGFTYSVPKTCAATVWMTDKNEKLVKKGYSAVVCGQLCYE